MCLLVFMKEDAIPDMDGLLEASYQNTDGFGYAILNNNSIVTGQDMNYDRLANRFIDARAVHKGPALFHLRWATHGATNKDNCHPFFLGGDRNTVMAHNGIMDVAIPKNDKRSDTKVFAEDIMPSIGGIVALDDKDYFKRLQDWAKGNRLVFLTTNDDAKSSSYIINENEGHWVDGVWYSNYGYQSYSVTRHLGSGWNKRWNRATGKYEDLFDDYDDEYAYDRWAYENPRQKITTITKQLSLPRGEEPILGETVKFVYATGEYAIQNKDMRTHYDAWGERLYVVDQKYYAGDNPPIWDVQESKWQYPIQTILVPAPTVRPEIVYTSTGKTVKEAGKTTYYDKSDTLLWTEYDREYWDGVGKTETFDDEKEIFDEHSVLSAELQELFDFVIPFDKPSDAFLAVCGPCGAGQTVEKEYLIYTTHCPKCDACYHCESKGACICWDELMAEAW